MDDFKTPDEFKDACGYTLENDVWYPRVTKIVEIKAKPALYYFYAKMPNYRAAEQVKEQSAVEGTMIHEAAEAILMGQKPVIPYSITPSMAAFAEYLLDNNIEVDPKHVEVRLKSDEHKYAGTLDAIARIGGKLGILDIKTSQEIYRDYNIQTSAYFYAMKELFPELSTRWILRIDQSRLCMNCGAALRAKGGREQVKIKWDDPFMRSCKHEFGPLVGHIELKELHNVENDFEAFLGAKRLWEWEHEEWLKKIGYLK